MYEILLLNDVSYLQINKNTIKIYTFSFYLILLLKYFIGLYYRFFFLIILFQLVVISVYKMMYLMLFSIYFTGIKLLLQMQYLLFILKILNFIFKSKKIKHCKHSIFFLERVHFSQFLIHFQWYSYQYIFTFCCFLNICFFIYIGKFWKKIPNSKTICNTPYIWNIYVPYFLPSEFNFFPF